MEKRDVWHSVIVIVFINQILLSILLVGRDANVITLQIVLDVKHCRVGLDDRCCSHKD